MSVKLKSCLILMAVSALLSALLLLWWQERRLERLEGELSESVRAYERLKQEADGKVEALLSELKAREAELERARVAAEEAQKRLELLEHKAEELEKQVQEGLEAAEKLEELEATAANSEALILNLRQQVALWKDQFGKMSALVAVKDQALGEKDKIIAAQAEQISNLKLNLTSALKVADIYKTKWEAADAIIKAQEQVIKGLRRSRRSWIRDGLAFAAGLGVGLAYSAIKEN